MKKFFQMVLVLAVSFINVGCMTHYVNVRTLQAGQSIVPDGGRVTYSHSETYTYDSGYQEYYSNNDPNSMPAYAQGSVRVYRIPPPFHHH